MRASCFLVLLLGSSASALRACVAHRPLASNRHAPPRCTTGDMTASELCRALQDGLAPDGLGRYLSTNAGAKAFLNEYLSGDDWTCAAEAEAPAAFADELIAASPPFVDAVLMNILRGAVATSEAERIASRASVLVSNVWDESPLMQQSCTALRHVVAAKLGVEPPAYAQHGDQNFEYAKDHWAGLLGFTNYNNEQLQGIANALESCSKEVAVEGEEEES